MALSKVMAWWSRASGAMLFTGVRSVHAFGAVAWPSTGTGWVRERVGESV